MVEGKEAESKDTPSTSASSSSSAVKDDKKKDKEDKDKKEKEDKDKDTKDTKDKKGKDEEKKEPEPAFEILQNPARVLRQQLKVIQLVEGSQYVPVKDVQIGGIIMLKHIKPETEEELVEPVAGESFQLFYLFVSKSYNSVPANVAQNIFLETQTMKINFESEKLLPKVRNFSKSFSFSNYLLLLL